MYPVAQGRPVAVAFYQYFAPATSARSSDRQQATVPMTALHREIISSVVAGRRFRLVGICCDHLTVRFQSWRDDQTASCSGCSFSAIEQRIRHFLSIISAIAERDDDRNDGAASGRHQRTGSASRWLSAYWKWSAFHLHFLQNAAEGSVVSTKADVHLTSAY